MITFGPVPSRRLGMSLGINNIVSPKTCSYSCIYCQVGKTRVQSVKREAFFGPEQILENLTVHLRKLKKENYPDYLTFVSNGEPTLDINLGKSIALIKETGIPVAVISNASMLHDEKVREELFLADWVSVKMDAADADTWMKINKPDPALSFERHMNGISLFAARYKGILNTETMVVKGVNDSSDHFSSLATIISDLRPAKAWISIPTRPPADKTVKPPDPETLTMAWHIYTDRNLETELLTGFEGTNTGFTGNIYEDILNITAVHPLREDSLAELLKKDNADEMVVDSLLKQKLIKQIVYNEKKYYLRDYHMNI
ncbi:MAG: radical SAM protein [Bacteroidales bacterium]|nr:radical SAM protein [Bacteroidales bacterium]MBN2633322.1 radical SAM protein [Bacteroidales bacterium]